MQRLWKASAVGLRLGFVMLLGVSCCHAEGLKDVDLVASSSADDRAVIKGAGMNELLLLKAGDVIPGTNTVVRQILADRLLLEEMSESQGKPSKSYFLFRAESGSRSRLEPLLSEAPQRPEAVRMVLTVPKVTEQDKKTSKKTVKASTKSGNKAAPASNPPPKKQ